MYALKETMTNFIASQLENSETRPEAVIVEGGGSSDPFSGPSNPLLDWKHSFLGPGQAENKFEMFQTIISSINSLYMYIQIYTAFV